ncbi:hypothetical protein [Burkholderia sp. Ac-20365]|uniref:hypothetical protein n=1 Tax=Burkholderia sp. Ac-20365 TaxID=2703897 RepID=UPI00197BD897|nr:hypothetical protein [Burkholderia sp. Ac-20365]MBN3760948.1 hypothetical protein [Burkholderia sp. Ac-20365]
MNQDTINGMKAAAHTPNATSGARGKGGQLASGTTQRLLDAGHARDVTAFARSIGYRGPRRVIVMDSKVISLRWIDWGSFCAACRARARRELH